MADPGQEDFGSEHHRALSASQAFPGPKLRSWKRCRHGALNLAACWLSWVWICAAQAEVTVSESVLIFLVLLVRPSHVYRPSVFIDVFYACLKVLSDGLRDQNFFGQPNSR